MKRTIFRTAGIGILLLLVGISLGADPDSPSPGESKKQPNPQAAVVAAPTPPQPPATSEEARDRARLLHAAIHGALRIMHRDFFRKGDSKAIPSESLEDVFAAMAEEQGVKMRWLASEITVMNVDNKATDPWQEAALKAVAEGKAEHETVEKGVYRYAGSIPIQNQCLKCHVPFRETLEERFAALEISMPLKPGVSGK